MTAHLDQSSCLLMTEALRSRIEATIEHLLALLDEIDGDPDLEPGGDSEPSLGWTYVLGRPVIPLEGGCDDRELENENDEENGDLELSDGESFGDFHC